MLKRELNPLFGSRLRVRDSSEFVGAQAASGPCFTTIRWSVWCSVSAWSFGRPSSRSRMDRTSSWDRASSATLRGINIYAHHPHYPHGAYAYFPLFCIANCLFNG